ncbi:MAG: 4'-phosphopantetheinyl transferase family protein [Candidatus Omnitrophota bacterium]
MIDVYALRLDFSEKFDLSLFETLLNYVSPEKRVRIKKFVREEDRLRGLFADLLIRHVIREKLGIPNKDIDFTTNYYGKPALKGRDDIEFNLSHSGEWVVGVIDNHPVGIDVEQIQSIDLDISKHYFSEDEHFDLMNKSDKFDYFFTLWSLKESYIKILGKGLSHPLNAFSIKYHSPENISMHINGQAIDDIFFRQYPIHNGYKMAVCTSHKRIPAQVNDIPLHIFIDHFLSHAY